MNDLNTFKKELHNGQYYPVYLLYGEESYLKRQYKHDLQNALVAEGDTMNSTRFDGKNISVSGLMDVAETMPFFAEHRVILVENSGFFKKGQDELAEYLPKTPSTTFFIFVEDEVDKRTKLYKSVKKCGRILELKELKEPELQQWILGRLKKENKNITRNAMQLFLSKTGTDMEIISNELENLLSYCLDTDVITVEEVNAVCFSHMTVQVFDMIDAIAARKAEKAISLYYEMLEQRQPPLLILSLLSRQFRILLTMKDLESSGMNASMIINSAGIHPWAAKKALPQMAGFTQEQLKSALEECCETEEAIKTGQIADRLGVELLIVKYSNPKSAL